MFHFCGLLRSLVVLATEWGLVVGVLHTSNINTDINRVSVGTHLCVCVYKVHMAIALWHTERRRVCALANIFTSIAHTESNIVEKNTYARREERRVCMLFVAAQQNVRRPVNKIRSGSTHANILTNTLDAGPEQTKTKL